MYKYVLQQFCLINSSNRYQLSYISQELRLVWPVDSCRRKTTTTRNNYVFIIILDQLISFRHVEPEMPASQLQRNDRQNGFCVEQKEKATIVLKLMVNMVDMLFGKRYFHFNRQHIIEYLLRRSLFEFSIPWRFTLIECQIEQSMYIHIVVSLCMSVYTYRYRYTSLNGKRAEQNVQHSQKTVM